MSDPGFRFTNLRGVVELSAVSLVERRQFLRLTAAALGTRALGSIAHASNLARIGWLWSGRSANNPNEVKGFQRGLHDLGYVEGQNVLVEYRFGEGGEDHMNDLAAELVKLPVDVLVIIGPPALHALQNTGTTIPIVAVTSDLEKFIASMARPGGSITGLDDNVGNLMGKRVQFLKEAIPTLVQVGLLTNPKFDTGESVQVTQVASSLGLVLRAFPVATIEEVKPTMIGLQHAGEEAMILNMTPPLFAYQQEVASLALELRLPTISEQPEFAEGGGLISYGTSIFDMAYRQAYYVDRILKGAKPADLPIEHPTKFLLVINLKTAKALGLEMPTSLLIQADKVIE